MAGADVFLFFEGTRGVLMFGGLFDGSVSLLRDTAGLEAVEGFRQGRFLFAGCEGAAKFLPCLGELLQTRLGVGEGGAANSVHC